MTKKDRFEELVLQTAQLIDKLRKYRGSVSNQLTPEIVSYLGNLEKAMTTLQDLNLRNFERAGLDLEKLKVDTFHSPSISLENKKLLQKIQLIEREAKQLQQVYTQKIDVKSAQIAPTKSSIKKKSKERKKRFKPLGGDKGWIPL